ncbi:2-oxoglutarate dehydrogenase E2 component (dihydrolipoamide succinyltransferase) [Propionibacterium cyclohexanicum]|uniref:Dihydrolipoamide acetyltransferase component of pyruvate dehydrogenase complex n=1 Tax=Propionibacterium cyclohexanicum TaxID=64702 RepID=A0A1H9PHH9_9ACTN|nr:2-oxoglutarate dehydrogenase, E2 component, dihydrolipoamide succinyltransferase [Propionibacterium cyclohexanicum]SER47692.1 2-oxoglutarate dehydrogenase E2 component (dihydrolipoamide succinyltransferase) [Propionibacterium cyclohexanicum]
MSTEVTLPTLGESVNEATVSRWLKEVGDHVDADEPLLEVSTDKVDTEIPAPVAGTLTEIRVNEDETAQVGQVLGIIGEASQDGAPASHSTATPTVQEPTPTPTGEHVQPEEPAKPQESAPTVVPSAEAEEPAEKKPSETASAQPSGAEAELTEVTLPTLGESVNEATVSRWLKEVGDAVEADEPLLEVSTDKVDTEIPAPAAGHLLEIRVKEDDTAQVGQVLAVIGEAASAQQPAPAPAEPAPSAPQASPAPAPGAPAQSAPTPPPAEKAQPAPAAQPAAERPAQPAPASPAPRATVPDFDGYVTPLVRKLARTEGVNLSEVKGTGVGGRIRKQDVLDAAAAAKAAQEAAARAAAAKSATPVAPSADADKRGTTEKLSKLRAIVAARMTESLRVSAQLTATVEVDLSAVARVRAGAKDSFRKTEGAGLTYLAFITKAATEALRQFPKVNSSIDVEAGTVTYHDSEDIGIAVDTPRGLMVPVIKGAGDLNVGGIAKRIADLAARSRDSKIGPDELTGATFTITNYGSTGTLFDTPIINQPNVAILGTGAMVKRPVVVTDAHGEDTIAIRPMMYLSMTYDHRIVDGADASRFLSAVKARLEEGDFGGEFGLNH